MNPRKTCLQRSGAVTNPLQLGLYFKKFLEIFQNVSRNFSKGCSKVALKNKNFFGSDAKICKLYNKSKISKHFGAILTLSSWSITTQKRNEPIKLLNGPLHPRHSSQSSVNLCPPFLIFSKNCWPSSPAPGVLRPLSAPGGGFGSFLLQEVHNLSTETLWNMEERPI